MALAFGLGLGGVSASAQIMVAPSGEFKWGNVTMGGGGFVSGIITSKTEKNVLYARTDVGGAYRWDEANQSWVSITDWITGDYMGLLGVDAMALDPSTPGRVYMLAGTEYWNNGKTMILRSDDYGANFDTINVTAQFKTHGNEYGRQNGERLAVDPHNPNILFCGTRKSGLWKSADRGSTWTLVPGLTVPTGGQGICFVIFDKNKAAGGVTQRIFAGMSVLGNNLYVSEDAGTTWSLIALPTLAKQVMPHRAVLTPKGQYLYVGTGNGMGPGFGNNATVSRGALLRYDTQAKTWANISPENWVDDPPHPDYPGQTVWDAHFGGFGGISMNPNDSNHLVVSSINTWKPQRWDNSNRTAWGDKIFSTTDGGKTWISVFSNGIADSLVPATPNDAPIAALNKNGYDWIEGESIHWTGSIEFDPFNPKRVFVTSGNGIYMAPDFNPGKRFLWNFTVRGLEETVPEDMVSIPGGPLITVIGDYDGFVHSDITKPPLKRHFPQLGSTTGLDYAKLNPGVVVRVGGNDKAADASDYLFPLYYSTDTAKTWTKFATHIGPGQNYKGKVAVSSDGKVVLWNPDGKNTLYRTEDWGATWTSSGGISGQELRPTADPVNPDVFYAFSSEVFKSTDKGKTFAKASSRNFSGTNDMQVTPGREGHVWVVGWAWDGVNGGYLARSKDGGTTFKNVDPADDSLAYTQKIQHAEAVGFGKAAPGAAYPAIYVYGTVGGVKGIYQSVDEGKTWARIDDAKHQYGALANGNFIRGDANTFGVVYRSTAGRGIAARMPATWNMPTSTQPRKAVNPSPGAAIRFTGQTLSLSPHPGQPLHIRIYGLDGSRVYRQVVRTGTSLPLKSLVSGSGMYFLEIRNNRSGILFSRKISVMP